MNEERNELKRQMRTVNNVAANKVSERNILIEQYLPLVHKLARDIYRKINGAVDIKDLIGYGEIGLVEAASRYNPQRGVNFNTYAYYRIKGAIYDGLREFGWIPKSNYRKIKFEESANELMAVIGGAIGLGQKGTDIESEAEEIIDIISNLVPIYILSLQSSYSIEKKVSGEAEQIKAVQRKELEELVNKLIKDLSNQEKKIIIGYYFENKTFKEIGKELNLSKSWIARIHAKIIKRMKIKLKSMGIKDKDV